MKKTIITSVAALFLGLSSMIYAQAPNAIPYQAVARNSGGNVIASQNISLRFSIHDGSAGGTVVYQETQSVTTNTLGLFTANIGMGTPVSGTFSAINWGTGDKFTQVEMDATGGTSYVNMGTSQMLSVPYALMAGKVPDGTYVDLTTNQTIAGEKTFTSDIKTSTNGRVRVGNGGNISNTILGADIVAVSGNDNVAVGWTALQQSSGGANVAVGSHAAEQMSGIQNIAIGYSSLKITSGSNNIAIGHQTGAITTGYENVGVGVGALGVTTTGWGNTAFGTTTLATNSSGSLNTALGRNADVATNNLDNATVIGANAIVDASNKVQIGNSNVNAVQLGTGSNVTLQTGAIKLTGGAPAAGKVLTSDANGLASWETPASPSGSFVDLTTDQTIAGEKTFVGTFGSGSSVSSSGLGTRMFFNPKKSAFRAGTVDGTQWDDANVGDYSTATGVNNMASGAAATAFGAGNIASGSNSMAIGLENTTTGTNSSAMGQLNVVGGTNSFGMGRQNTVAGPYSTALGSGNSASGYVSSSIGAGAVASGDYSSAIGRNSTASGVNSHSVGYSITAPSYNEIVIGLYNTSYTPNSTTTFNANDRLFVIGNGQYNANSNAMVVLKNGNIGFGTSTPDATAKLDISSTTQGFLPPRMTVAQRNAIASPASGLTIFCSDDTANDASTGVTETWNGTSWKKYW